MAEPLFLGLDLSTQQLKAVLLDDSCRIVKQCSVNFGKELTHFGLENGVQKHEDGETFTAPVYMWLEAIDLLFAKLSKDVDLSTVRSISGCAQQHGTVYWSKKAASLLSELDYKKPLSENLQGAFVTVNSPIWMDSSTTEECHLMENRVGGPLQLLRISGSKAYHRFSGNQIMKFYRREKNIFDAAEKISLVSSFVACILCGGFVDIDMGDACGMNLMDLESGEWSEKCLNAVVEGNMDDFKELQKKLGTPLNCETIVGEISAYFCVRYGLPANCKVVAFTGDNLSSLAGLCLQVGQVAVSLGTSDTVLFVTSQCAFSLEGHLFRNPVDSNAFMGMLCFKNGSFTRNRIKEQVGAADWDEFASLVSKSPVGNNENIGFYFDENEIIPNVKRGDYRFDKTGKMVENFSKENEARAILEHQSMAKRVHAKTWKNDFDEKGTLLITGGASTNPTIAQILGDVFNSDVYIAEPSDTAALGGALRARHVCCYKDKDYFAVSNAAVKKRLIASPKRENVEVYNELLIKYAKWENRLY